MKYYLAVITLFLVFTLGIYASFSRILAQDGVNDSDAAPTPGTVVTDTETATTTDDGFNLFWLLPLIAIPILAYLLWPRKKDEDEMVFSGDYAGAKGGKAEHEAKEDEIYGDEVEDYKSEAPRYPTQN